MAAIQAELIGNMMMMMIQAELPIQSKLAALALLLM
jgi:hypothetical protein